MRNNEPADLIDKSILSNIEGKDVMEEQISKSDSENPEFLAKLKEKYPNQNVKLNVVQNDELGNPIPGHDILLKKDGNIYDPGNDVGYNNCAYAVSLTIQGKEVNLENIQRLKDEIANEIETNSNISIAIESQSWIQSRYP